MEEKKEQLKKQRQKRYEERQQLKQKQARRQNGSRSEREPQIHKKQKVKQERSPAQLARRKRKIVRAALFVSILLAAAAISCAVLWNTRITEFKVYGNNQCTEEEVANMIFENTDDTRFLYAWFKEKTKPHRELARLESYELKFDGIQTAEIIVKENKMIGCVNYMESYLYFDKNGLVVKSTVEPIDEIPQVEGFIFRKITLNETLQTDPEDIFQGIVQITQSLDRREITAEKILFDPGKKFFSIQIGDIRVILGSEKYLDEKITELKGILSVLTDRKGILHLEDYDILNLGANYYFELEDTDQQENEENS